MQAYLENLANGGGEPINVSVKDDEGKIRIENTWYTLFYDVRLENGEKPDINAIRKEFTTLQEHLQKCSDMCVVDWPFKVPVEFSPDMERILTEGSSCELLSDEGIQKEGMCLGIPDRFIHQGSIDQLRKEIGLDPESIADKIRNKLSMGL